MYVKHAVVSVYTYFLIVIFYSLLIKLYLTALKCTYKHAVVCGYTYFLIHAVKCTMREIEVKGFRMLTCTPDSGTHMCMLTCIHINMYVSCTYHTKVTGNDKYEFTAQIFYCMSYFKHCNIF